MHEERVVWNDHAHNVGRLDVAGSRLSVDHPPLTALVSSVNAIRQASGIGTMPGPNRGAGGGPLHAEPPPTAAPPARSER